MRSKLLAAVALSAVLITGCGSKSASVDTSALADSLVKDITYEEQLSAVDSGDVSDYFGDLEEGVECVLYMGSGKTAEEVAVFTAPDEKKAEATKETVQNFLNDQKTAFKAYIPEEAKRIEDAVLEQKGKYVVLCVSGDSAAAKDIINKAFEE